MGNRNMLTLLGYQAALGMEQTASCAHGIYLANGWTSIVLGIIGTVVFMFYRLDKKTLETVERELAERRAAQTK